MTEFTEKELRQAFALWAWHYREAQYLNRDKSPVKRARLALYLSQESVAKSLTISREGYAILEKNCENKTISLKKLEELARALDCEFTYEIKPKSQKTFEEVIWGKLMVEAAQHGWLKKCDPKRKAGALAGIVKRLEQNPGFRRRQGWSQTRPSRAYKNIHNKKQDRG